MIPPLDAGGLLPHGRHRCTVGEVEAVFVDAPAYAASSTRSRVWQDFLDVISVVQSRRVRLPAAFLGGSFTTDTMDPSDVDASVLYDASRISSPATIDFINKTFVEAKPSGYKLDIFSIPWWPLSDPPENVRRYWVNRGQWDDWWQRHVPKAERDPFVRAHALPRRGYLEVILDDFS